MLKRADVPFEDDVRAVLYSSVGSRSEEGCRRELSQIQTKLRNVLSGVISRVSSIGYGPDGPEARVSIAIQGEYVADAQRLVPEADVRPLTQEEYEFATGTHGQSSKPPRTSIGLFDSDQMERAA